MQLLWQPYFNVVFRNENCVLWIQLCVLLRLLWEMSGAWRKKCCKKCMHRIADAFFQCYILRKWVGKEVEKKGEMETWWEGESSEGNCSSSSVTIHISFQSVSHLSECIPSSSFCLFLKLFKILSQSFLYIYLLPECFWLSVSWT